MHPAAAKLLSGLGRQTGRRDAGPARKFVFGADEAPADGTMIVPALQMAKARGQGVPSKRGFDMNLSRRMASIAADEPVESRASIRGRRFVFGMLFIAFALFCRPDSGRDAHSEIICLRCGAKGQGEHD